VKLSDLPDAVVDRIKSRRYDQIIEKHEGPENWAAVLEWDDPEFMSVLGYDVLLPVARDRHANIQILRCIPSADGRTLTLFLKDTGGMGNSRDELFYAGRVAVCDKFDGEQFYLATLYHEWFIIEDK